MANWNPRFREAGFREFLEEAIEWEDLEPTALGIAKQALNQGVESLSEKQYFVFQKHVLEAHAVNRCIQCEEEIPWHEMIDVRVLPVSTRDIGSFISLQCPQVHP
jgi:hypothetical protein